MDAVRSAGTEWPSDSLHATAGVQLNEWQREGWTYHAKGDPVFSPLLSTHALTLRVLSYAYVAVMHAPTWLK